MNSTPRTAVDLMSRRESSFKRLCEFVQGAQFFASGLFPIGEGWEFWSSYGCQSLLCSLCVCPLVFSSLCLGVSESLRDPEFFFVFLNITGDSVVSRVTARATGALELLRVDAMLHLRGSCSVWVAYMKSRICRPQLLTEALPQGAMNNMYMYIHLYVYA